MPHPKTLAGLALAVTLLAPAAPAHAQLGTSGNVPPQHLFETDRPARLNEDPGDTMQQRRARLAQARRAQRPVRR